MLRSILTRTHALLVVLCSAIFMLVLPISLAQAGLGIDLSKLSSGSILSGLRRTVTCREFVFTSGGLLSPVHSSFSVVSNSYQIPSSSLLVDDTGSTADYSSIQDAIEAATDGGKVYVCPGHYYEQLSIQKDLSLLSLAGADKTIIDASTSGDGSVINMAGSVTIRGFTITGSRADYSCYYGGGIKVSGSSGQILNEVVIENNKIIDNTACKAGGLNLGGFDSSDGTHVDNTVTLRNNIIAGNYANTTNAGGIMLHCDNNIDTVIENNVFADNGTTSGSGGIELVGTTCDVDIRNNIFYGNISSSTQNVIADYTSTATIEYNDTYGNSTNYTGGTGNINSDPDFVNEVDYELDSTSPCVDAGDPSSDYDDTDGSTNDMGAYGGENGDW